MQAPKPSFRLLPALIVALAAFLAHSPALDGSFVYDDHHYLLENPAVQGEASVWTSPLGVSWQGLWRPLTVASLAAQWSQPPDAAAYHAFDLVLHALVSLLVLVLGLRLGLSRAAAAMAGLLFAVHPVHAEAVAWVSGRAEVLAAGLVVAAWIAHRGEGRLSALLSGALVLLAGLAKENALVAPGLFLLGDLIVGRTENAPGPSAPGTRRLALTRLVPPALAVLVVLGLRLALLEHVTPGHGPFLQTDLAGRVVVALAVLGRGLRLLVWPHPLRVEYQKDEVALLGSADLLALAGFVLCVWLARRRLPGAAAGLLLVPLALLPVLHLVPIGEPFAERFLYLPSVPFCIAVGALLGGWMAREARRPRGPGPSLIAAGVLSLAGLLGARQASAVFHDDLTLWSHAARVAPHVALARYNNGSFLLEAERLHPESRARPGALAEFSASLELAPRHAWAGWAHLALARAALDPRTPTPPRHGTAAAHLRAAIDIDPNLVDARLLFAGLALSAPDSVGRSEGLAALQPLVGQAGLDPGRRADVATLRAQLSSANPTGGVNTGTSSDDGS